MTRTLFLPPLALTFLAVCGCGHPAAPATTTVLENNTVPPMNVFSPPPVHATEIPSSPDDDAAAKLREALSSDNPNERLQIVRQAQDKWGSTKVAADIDQKAIVGRWNNPTISAAYITFNADGTFKNVALLKDTEGTYRFLSHNAIEFTSPGTLYGENAAQLEYRLFGDTLELKQFGTWIRYRRATQ